MKTADKEKIRILSHINECRNEISDIENVHQYIYDQTAEVKARNKTILWWILIWPTSKTKAIEINSWKCLAKAQT